MTVTANQRVFIVQELGDDEVPDAKVYLTPSSAASHAVDLMEYGGLETEDGEDDPATIAGWTGDHEIELYDNEGAVRVHLYSTEVK